jgi:hypothetical protein
VPTFTFPETFTIHTRGVTGTDSDGNDVYGDTDTTTTGAFAPAGSTELVQGQNTVLTHPTIYLDDGAPVPSSTDQVTVRGVRYDIDGQPQVFHNPFTGYEPGAVVKLLKVTG